MGDKENSNIDEGLYSRQIYVLGKDAMKSMAKSSILICGLDGLGLEVAKNIILAGVKLVSLYDPRPPTAWDLSTHYYLDAESVLSHSSKSRTSLAHFSRDQLAELNPYVTVDVVGDDAGEDSSSTGSASSSQYKHSTLMPLPPVELVTRYCAVVLCQQGCARPELLDWADAVRQRGVYLILLNTRGLFGQLFLDFGDEFVVKDVDGEEPPQVMVQAIENAQDAIVTCLEETRLSFESGDYVTFEEVKGMVELNGCEPRQIKVLGPYEFSIGDTRHMSPYASGGVCKLVKMPQKFAFKSLRDSLSDPEFMWSDFAKFSRPEELHLCFQALDQYRDSQAGELPRVWNLEDAAEFLKYVRSPTGPRVPTLFACTCGGNLAPMQSVFGGIAAQEVMKACSHRFTPIHQWFYFDCEEILPETVLQEVSREDQLGLNPEECTVSSKSKTSAHLRRYTGQIAVLGKKFQRRLNALQYFVVGAGAIGCELLKNFAMMGVGCGTNGKVVVTDMDFIERSNLNRQFLFRTSDIGNAKSSSAANSVRKMNPQMNIESYELRVGPESEGHFTEAFFEGLDGVANALDNIEARAYVDRRCIFFRKSLLDSGTLGTKGSVQVVVPHLTETYTSSTDPPEKSTPICTLKNFPYAIEHTLQWARDTFEGLFYDQAQAAADYLADPEGTLQKIHEMPGFQPQEVLQNILTVLVKRPSNFQDCVQWARELFEEYFVNTIKQILNNFPPDHLTESGTPFWSGTKRCPHPLVFDSYNSTHLTFIISAANLRAAMFGLRQAPPDPETFRDYLAECRVKPFQPRDNVKIALNDSEMSASNGAALAMQEENRKPPKLPSVDELEGVRVYAQEFEKDDDTNFHMDFIVSTSNLRAENYGITPADRLKSKLIAGKIIPAIATATSIVAGLVCIELYKLAQGHRNVEMFKNAFFNLALSTVVLSEPIRAPVMKYNKEHEFTLWDRFELRGEMTLEEFLNYFKQEHNLQISVVSHGTRMLYADFQAPNVQQKRMSMTIREIVELVSKQPIGKHVRSLLLELVCVNEDDYEEDVFVPFVKYNLS